MPENETPLPQPPRDPWTTEQPEHHTQVPDGSQSVEQPEVDATPTETVEEPQEAAEAPQTTPLTRGKINLTVARQIDERVRVMQDRLESFRKEFAKVGVVNADQVEPGLRARYVESLLHLDQIERHTEVLREATAGVRETLENL